MSEKMHDKPTPEQMKFAERLQIVQQAIDLKEPYRVPVFVFVAGLPHELYGGEFKNTFYNYPRAREDVIKYHEEFQPDAAVALPFMSGKANEIAGSTMIDWPGRPGTGVPNHSSHQVIEQEYMTPDEYPEMLRDFTGFMLRKYIPRAYPALSGFADFQFKVNNIQGISSFPQLYSPAALKSYQALEQIAKAQEEANGAARQTLFTLMERGFPPFFTGGAEAPFDVLGDFFRGTMGILEDQIERPDMILEACNLFADMQIEAIQSMKDSPLPVKRVFIPLHKGTDSFMSPEQYRVLYWEPLKRLMMAMIDIGVTPYVYTEGQYNTRLEQLADVPVGKVIYHFEQVDMKRAKKVLGNIACISGNLSAACLAFSTKQEIIDRTKELIDTCAPGGGYIFDTDSALDNAKRENVEAMFETLHTYGAK